MTATPLLVSIQIGLPQPVPDPRTGHVRTTAIYKQPVTEAVWIGKNGIPGDGVGNPRVHGGPDKALNAYAVEHYAHWAATLGRADSGAGMFGENFSLRGLLEEDACIGDVYQVGDAQVQISQPRQPCKTLARRWGVPDFDRLVDEAGFTGWYFRVVREGQAQAGQPLTLLERGYAQWTVARANRVMLAPRAHPLEARELMDLPPLSAAWQNELRKALAAA